MLKISKHSGVPVKLLCPYTQHQRCPCRFPVPCTGHRLGLSGQPKAHLKEHRVPHSLAGVLLPCLITGTQWLELKQGSSVTQGMAFRAFWFCVLIWHRSLLQSTWQSEKCYIGIKYYFLLGGVLKENVGSLYCFPNIAERKPCAMPLCSSYALSDGNTYTVVFTFWFQSPQEGPSHRKCSWGTGSGTVCLESLCFQCKALDPCGVQMLCLFVTEGLSETSGLAGEQPFRCAWGRPYKPPPATCLRQNRVSWL